ncbi:PDDEXK nuclease domain-containing protein [Mucilaginibacter sabulilitoris]|uniref:PDDEXK nuclease domain-containing protein n=1 Tax=Mucilaginibacter sabulilitoris TaxID=1173583 RepID=A0ABZ0TT90_9SPHI|nr:PDDEXK nuclease domain-containing protein [Mucilaginibacter sabulilitoris]WPU94670.1 PDDEXK nuclease domain-containing protein [Mucilaginibacter sabulilitoris]
MTLTQSIVVDIQAIISTAREKAARSVDRERVIMYWHIGNRIFEEEQHGRDRAAYGTRLIKYLSEQLQPQFGRGFSSRNLNLFRQFYRSYPIVQALPAQLSWTHYSILLGIENEGKRAFYEKETVKNNWTSRQVERQISSHLYERLLLSTDKGSLQEAANIDDSPKEPKDIIKDPLILEFLGLKPEASYYEKDLESALITHLQEFMLELGNGFSFVARQKRIHLDGDDFYVDLVFYNRLLQCFVIIELKTHKITHQDLGQLQMYVNYYDRIERLRHETPTVGILLCLEKNDTVVKFTLPENSNVFASKYQLYLPTAEQLTKEIQNEVNKRK